MIEYKEVNEGEETGQGYEKVVWESGDIWYRLDGLSHREDGPAITRLDGYQAWFINGIRHREDGPARIFPDGHKTYCLDGAEVIPENYHLFSPLQLAKLGLI